MLTADAEGLRRAVWAGPSHRGHYEVWYLTLCDPSSGRRAWLRHTVHTPPGATGPDGDPGHAALWAFTFEAPGADGVPPGTAAVDRYPLEAFAPRPDGVALGPATFGPRSAVGRCGAGDQAVAWDLALEPAGPGPDAFRHVPPVLYAIRLAGSRVSTPSLALRATGTITVGEGAGATVWRLEGAAAEHGHVLGRRHADRWAWAHVHAFEGAPPWATFEGVSARVRRLGRLLAPASPFLLRTARRVVLVSCTRRLWRPTSAFELGRWTLELEGPSTPLDPALAAQGGPAPGGQGAAPADGEPVRVRVEVTAPPARFLSVEYADPDGGPVFCNHAEHADAAVEVHVRRGGAWALDERLEARGTVAFEIGERGARDPRPPRRFDLAASRRLG